LLWSRPGLLVLIRFDVWTPTRCHAFSAEVSLPGWFPNKASVIAVAMVLCAVVPVGAYAVYMVAHGVSISKATLLFDLVLLGYVSAVFMRFQCRSMLACLPFIIIATCCLIAAAQKYILLRVWVRVSDLVLLPEAWAVISGVHQVLLASVGVVALVVTIYNFKRPSVRPVAWLVAPMLLAVFVLSVAPSSVLRGLRASTNAVYGNDPLYRSVFFALAYDLAERWTFEKDAAAMLSSSSGPLATELPRSEIGKPRNVHVFVMESLTDPLQLGLPVARDPFDPRFRENIGGDSLSPVFGGRTAQAEFEVLCGTPAYDLLDPITFNDLRGGVVACLPSILRDQGYLTLASSDVPATFFNMGQAYESLGFARSRFRDDLPATDMDGDWISADSRIATNKVTVDRLLAQRKPFLNYVLFVTGHIPYEMNPALRPPVIDCDSTAEVSRMVNSVYYNTRAVAGYVEYLRERDPASIIVVMSDHQGALASIDRSSDWSNVFALDRYRTPYIFIDAGKVLRPGDISHFDIPHMILGSLHGVSYTPVVQRYGVELMRPIGRQTFYVLNGDVLRSPSDEDPLSASVDEFRDMSVMQWLRLIYASRSKGR
jgi:phosphoglycerol transferase MdoB-like AlkP superfamily enzyme